MSQANSEGKANEHCSNGDGSFVLSPPCTCFWRGLRPPSIDRGMLTVVIRAFGKRHQAQGVAIALLL